LKRSFIAGRAASHAPKPAPIIYSMSPACHAVLVAASSIERAVFYRRFDACADELRHRAA